MRPSISSKSSKNKSHRRFLLQALGFACLAAALLPSARAQTAYTWSGGTGDWDNNAQWDPTATPDGANADVYIDGGKTGVNSVVTMNTSHTVGRLTVDAGDTLNLGNNVDFYLASSFAGSESIINNGTINFNSTGSGIYLHYVGANASLTGTGTINMTGPNDRIFAQNASGDRLTIGAGSTIAGTGNLGIGQSTFTNNGLVNANISGATLALQPGGGNGSDFTNGATGLAQASNGGILQLANSGNFNNGTFRALAGSTVNIGSGANVNNAILTTVGTGQVVVTDNATLNNVTNNGTLVGANNSITFLTGTLTNNGTFTLASTGSGVDIRFTGSSETLAGTGTVVMTGVNDRVFATNSNGDRLTINQGASITGTGNLGIGISTFTNNGTVNANLGGQTLTLQPGGGQDSAFTNGATGVTVASNGGTLALFGGGNFNNGTFQALANSFVTIGGGANVNNAALATTGSGTVTLVDVASLNNVTNAGTLNAANNSTTYLYNTLTNNGTFNLNSAGSGVDLRFVGPSETLAGTGTIVMNGPSDRIFANNANGDRLTINQGASITGQGNLGVGQSTFTNNGTVNANVSGATLTLQPGGGQDSTFTNGATGVAEATNGGTLALINGTFSGSGFQALAGSTLTVGANANLVGATLTTTGTGTVVLTDVATLNDVTNNGTVNAANNAVTFLVGTLTNNGTFSLNSTGSGVDIRFIGVNETLAGTGTIVMNGPFDRIYANNANGDRLTINAGASITGTGNLGAGQSTFTNNGTVNANQSGLALTLQPGGGQDSAFTSAAGAVTEASNGGVLVLQGGGGFTGAGGFQALAGSQVNLTGNPNVNNTTLSAVGSGVVNLLDVATLTDVTTNGTVNAANNAVTFLYGTLTNNGTINLNSTGSGDDIRFVGQNETLAGTGTLNLNGPFDRIYANNGAGDRLTINQGATIAGTGNLGAGQSTFTNNGTVNANQSGLALTLQPGGGQDSTFTTGATGVTEATNGGGMVQTGGNFTNNGTYAVVSGSIGGGSSLSVDPGHLTNFQGTTLTGGTYNVISTDPAATSTLSFGGGAIVTNAANVTLSGAGTVFTEINALAVNQGSFAVANGRNFTTVGALANSGTLVAAGGSTLAVTGALIQSGTGTLTGAGTFAATGGFTLSGNVNPGGTVNPATGAFANAAGTTTLNGDAAFDVNTKFNFELGSITGTNDHLNVTGLLNLNGTLNVAALPGFGTGVYDLIDHPLTSVVLSGLTLGDLPAGYTYTLLYLPNQVDLSVVQNVIPEPGTWAFVLGGATLLLGAGHFRRRA